MLCIFLSVPQSEKNKDHRNPNADGQKQETKTPNQAAGASCFVEQPPIKDAEQQYDPYSDRLYRAYLGATILGVCFSLIVVGLLIRQNGLTRKSADAADKSAQVAERNTNALVVIQRAWIHAEVIWVTPRNPLYDFMGNDGETHTLIDIDLSCVNYGATPAWIYERHIKFEITNSVAPKPDVAGADVSYQIHPLNKDQKAIEWRRDKLTGIGTLVPGKRAFVYGVVRYRDIFDKERETWFGFTLDPSVGLERMAHHEYNKNT